MITNYRFYGRSTFRCALAVLLLAGIALAEHDSTNCNGAPEPHVQLGEGDQSTNSHLQLSRKIAKGVAIDMDICSADLTIARSSEGVFKVTVDIARPSEHSAVDYVETMDVSPSEVKLQLHLPRSIHAKVTIEVPPNSPDLHVNLARGDLTFTLGRDSGDRKVNVGYGHVDYRGNRDTYQSMEINVGLGSLHDHREGGESHHLIVAHSFEGTGEGSVEINVGMGSVDVNPGPDGTV